MKTLPPILSIVIFIILLLILVGCSYDEGDVVKTHNSTYTEAADVFIDVCESLNGDDVVRLDDIDATVYINEGSCHVDIRGVQ